MSRVQILGENWLDTDLLNTSSVTSARTGFPKENVYNGQRRTKVWRSNGAWEITAANNALVIQNAVGIDLTASVAVATYSSLTAFLAALKTALDATGGATYTVSQHASGKIQIVSNGGGGGILTLKTSAVGSTLAGPLGFDTAVDRTGSLTYVADELRLTTGEIFKWDLGLSSNPEAFVLAGPRNEPIRLNPSATLKLQGNTTDVWSAPEYEQTLTWNDQAIVLFQDGGLHTGPLRFWRLVLQDWSNPLGYSEIGQIYLGPAYSPTRGCAQFPLGLQPQDRSTTIFSEDGQSYSDPRQKTEEFGLSWKGLTLGEKQEMDTLFQSLGTTAPFFVILDPAAVFSDSVGRSTKYVKFLDEPNFDLVSPNHYTGRMRLREEL